MRTWNYIFSFLNCFYFEKTGSSLLIYLLMLKILTKKSFLIECQIGTQSCWQKEGPNYSGVCWNYEIPCVFFHNADRKLGKHIAQSKTIICFSFFLLFFVDWKGMEDLQHNFFIEVCHRVQKIAWDVMSWHKRKV